MPWKGTIPSDLHQVPSGFRRLLRGATSADIGSVNKSHTLLLPALAIALLLSGAPLHSETLLIAVTETVDGKPSPLPPPATEGIFDGLFESGNIVFNTEDGSAPLSSKELVRIAGSGGAKYVLVAAVTFQRTPLAGGLTGIMASARFSLIAVERGATLGAGTLTDDNRGREKDMDLAKLGFELGEKIAKETVKLMVSRPSTG